MAATFPVANEMLRVPGGAEREPPQLLTGAGEAAMVKPSGSVSAKPRLVSAKLLVFKTVIVSMEVALSAIGLGEKALLKLTPPRLVREACAALELVAPLKVVTAAIGILFVKLPLTFIVTLRVKSQLAVAARLPPMNENVLEPGDPLNTPPHVPVFRLAGAAMYMPEGMVSAKAIPLRRALLGFVSLTSSVDAEPPKTVRGVKLLFTVTLRLATVNIAVAGN